MSRTNVAYIYDREYGDDRLDSSIALDGELYHNSVKTSGDSERKNSLSAQPKIVANNVNDETANFGGMDARMRMVKTIFLIISGWAMVNIHCMFVYLYIFVLHMFTQLR